MVYTAPYSLQSTSDLGDKTGYGSTGVLPLIRRVINDTTHPSVSIGSHVSGYELLGLKIEGAMGMLRTSMHDEQIADYDTPNGSNISNPN